MERAEQAARELREGLEKLRRVVTDHRHRMVVTDHRHPTVGTAASHEPAANDEAPGDAAAVDGADNDR